MADPLFSLDTPVSYTIKTDCYDITDILLKVALSTINLTLTPTKAVSSILANGKVYLIHTIWVSRSKMFEYKLPLTIVGTLGTIKVLLPSYLGNKCILLY